MRLQSHDEFASVARFRPESAVFVEMPLDDAADLLSLPLGGHFSRCLGELAVLYRHAGALRFRVGGIDLPLDELNVEWSADDGVAQLALSWAGGFQSFDYVAAESLDVDLTAGAEPEHFDFGLFVANVAADSGRAGRLYLDET